MEAEQPQPVTRLLRQWAAGNRDCLDQLVPMVDAELRRIARRHLRLGRFCRLRSPDRLERELG